MVFLVLQTKLLGTQTSYLFGLYPRKTTHCSPMTDSSTSTSIDANHLLPGMCVSGDQLESSTPGHIPTFKGSPTTTSFCAGTYSLTMLVNISFSLLIYPWLLMKLPMLSFVLNNIPPSFTAPSVPITLTMGVFCSKLFWHSCSLQHQGICYNGVNAHHQNRIAERYIHTITEQVRTMLIHA